MRNSTKQECDAFESQVATQLAWNNYVLMTTKTAIAETEPIENEMPTCKSKINTVSAHKLKNPILKSKIRNAKSAGNQDMLEIKPFLMSELVEDQLNG